MPTTPLSFFPPGTEIVSKCTLSERPVMIGLNGFVAGASMRPIELTVSLRRRAVPAASDAAEPAAVEIVRNDLCARPTWRRPIGGAGGWA